MDAISPQPPGEGVEAAIARLARDQHGAFSRRQALELGASPSHLKHGARRGRYRRLHRGVYATSSSRPGLQQRAMAACLAHPGRIVASHRTAGNLWGLAAIEPGKLEVTATVDTRLPHAKAVIVPAIPSCDVTTIERIPVTTPTRTIIDLAAITDEDGLEIALDDALRRGLTSMSRLRWRAEELCGRGRAGSALIGRVIGRRPQGPVPESVLETKVLQVIRRAKLPDPQRQLRVAASGSEIGRVDLAWPAQRVIVEVDGYRYHSGRFEWERDLARRNALEAAGWKVMHITAQQLDKRGRDFVEQLGSLLDAQTSFFRA